MVITRSKNHGELLSLPSIEKPIIVSCSEIYSALHHDLFSCLLDAKYKTREDIQEKKKKMMHNFSEHSRELSKFFLYKVNPVIENASLRPFMGLENREKNLNPYFLRRCLYVHKYYFLNKSSHVEGTIDALLHRDLWKSQFLNVSEHFISEKDYAVLYFCKDSHKVNPYHHMKAMAQLYYFGKMYPREIETNKIIFVDKTSFKVVDLTENDIERIQCFVCDIRKAKKIGWIDLEDNISNSLHPKYYPNMKIQDSLFEDIKKKYAFQWGEITSLWWCSDQHRQKMISMGIFSWRDARFTPELLATMDSRWNHSEKQRILNRILKTNRQDPSSPEFKWMWIDDFNTPEYTQSIFIDFEYLSTMNDLIYMIGVYIPENNQYKVFWASELTIASEKALLKEFYQFYSGFKKTNIWFWFAEKNKWQKRCHVHGLQQEAKSADVWEDLCDIMTHGVSVYGATNYKLKTITKAFSDYGKIPFSYQDLDCQNGLESMEFAVNYYKTRKEEDRMSLEKYNQLDCESQFHILQTIQENKKNCQIYI
jgi:hypothetical protein